MNEIFSHNFISHNLHLTLPPSSAFQFIRWNADNVLTDDREQSFMRVRIVSVAAAAFNHQKSTINSFIIVQKPFHSFIYPLLDLFICSYMTKCHNFLSPSPLMWIIVIYILKKILRARETQKNKSY